MFRKPLLSQQFTSVVLSLAASQRRDPGTKLHGLAVTDARLERVCVAWSALPEHVILTLVDSPSVVEDDRLHPVPRLPQTRAVATNPDYSGTSASLKGGPADRLVAPGRYRTPSSIT